MALKIKDYADTTFVTGMRAYAALAVLLIHSGGAGLRGLGQGGGILADMGGGGVYAFFVISGFSVATSYPGAGGFGRYLFHRIFRLAPLYYVWLAISWIVFQRMGYWGSTLGTIAWGWDLVLHVFFLHAFFPQVANSIIGVEWSLSVEMFWYLCLPAMLVIGRWGNGVGLIVSAALAYTFCLLFQIWGFKTAGPIAMPYLLWHPFVYFFSLAGFFFAGKRIPLDLFAVVGSRRICVFVDWASGYL